MGNHMHLTSLTRQQETQTLPLGPEVRMLNRDNQKVTQIKFLPINNYTLYILIVPLHYHVLCQIHTQI